MQITGWDLAIILAYMVMIAAVGILSQRKVKNTKDYYVAGRSLPTFALVATICASVIGGSALIGKGGYAYNGGVICIAIGLPYMIGMFIFSAFSGKISHVGHKYGFTSMSEMMGYRFGKIVKYITAIMVAYTSMATVGAQISATGTIISTIGGDNVSYLVGALIATVIFVAYTASSGLFGVVYTDIIQFIVLLAFIYILLPIKGISAVGGLGELITNTDPAKWDWNLSPKIITLIVTNFVMTIAGAEFWQRAFAAKDRKAAFKGQFWGTSVYAVTIVITMFIGLAAALLYPTLVEDYGTADYAIPVMIVKLLPAGLAGLTLAGLLSVMMSSADSYLLVSTQAIIGDIIKPNSKNMDEKKELRLSRICSIVFGVFAFLVAMFFTNAYDALMFGWTFYAATLGVPCLAAIVWKKATTQGILAGMAVGFVISIAWNLAGSPLGIGSTIIGVVLNAIVCVTVSLATYKKYPSKEVSFE
ncbi:MAG: sodium:solute symporter family protein [Clostridiales bacterium]|nr:sodium:solute symporter family protein [Clostridiales bacterium]